jgi:hypothetical protein
MPLVISLVSCAYALVYGTAEMFGLPLRSFDSKWQVPPSWVKGSVIKRNLLWGTILGPGLITRNPYAGIWLLPLLIVLARNPLLMVLVGIGIGAAHGIARALGVLRNRKRLESSCDAMFLLGAQLQWRCRDGILLLVTAGALSAYIIWMLVF